MIEEIKKLSLKNNDVVILKGNYSPETLEEFRKAFSEIVFGINILLAHLPDGCDIGTISEEEMNKVGWFRKK